MKRVFLAAVLFIACHHESSPTALPLDAAALTGKVTNATTGAPVNRALVSVTQSGQTIATESASTGLYQIFGGLLPGNAQVRATATGYDTFTGSVSLSAGSNRYDIQLRPSP